MAHHGSNDAATSGHRRSADATSGRGHHRNDNPATGAGPDAGLVSHRVCVLPGRQRPGGASEARRQAGSGDALSLQVQTSVPMYFYVVNEDERGNSFLLFPLPGQALQNPFRPDSDTACRPCTKVN